MLAGSVGKPVTVRVSGHRSECELSVPAVEHGLKVASVEAAVVVGGGAGGSWAEIVLTDGGLPVIPNAGVSTPPINRWSASRGSSYLRTCLP
jgi:hypothetical protein